MSATEDDALLAIGGLSLASGANRTQRRQAPVQDELSRLSNDELHDLRNALSHSYATVGRIFRAANMANPSSYAPPNAYQRNLPPPLPRADAQPDFSHLYNGHDAAFAIQTHPRDLLPLICGAQLPQEPEDLPNWSHLHEFEPFPLPSYPYSNRSADNRKPKKSNGCGALIHTGACLSDKNALFIAKGSATEAVVHLPREYFDDPDAKEGTIHCGCKWHGVGCRHCGNSLGEHFNACARHAERFGTQSMFTFNMDFVTAARPLNQEDDYWRPFDAPTSVTAPAERTQSRVSAARQQIRPYPESVTGSHPVAAQAHATSSQSQSSMVRMRPTQPRPAPQVGYSPAPPSLGNNPRLVTTATPPVSNQQPPRAVTPPSCPTSPAPHGRRSYLEDVPGYPGARNPNATYMSSDNISSQRSSRHQVGQPPQRPPPMVRSTSGSSISSKAST